MNEIITELLEMGYEVLGIECPDIDNINTELVEVI